MPARVPPQVETTSESSILLRFGESIERALNDRVHAAVRALQSPPIPGIVELVPAYASVAIHYDPAVWLDASVDQSPAQRLADAVLERLANSVGDTVETTARIVEIPVCYDPLLGEDLLESSCTLGISVDELSARHAGGDYRVAMLGFAPGFPYLLGLDPSLHLPRRSQPRLRVPAGSVAIGGAQTGIYPTDLPGGWRRVSNKRIGVRPIRCQPPHLVIAGDRVRFIRISGEQFDSLVNKNE